jgi:hypothetical protein
MTTAAWMAGLLLVANAGTPETHYIGRRDFEIPIGIKDPSRRGDIKEVRLFVADGKNWQPYGVAGPDKQAFVFHAPEDGVYLFRMSVIGRGTDKQEDGDPNYIVVDTVKPVVRIQSAERQGDDVVVRWQLDEKNPDYKSLRLEYLTSEAPGTPWTAAPVAAPETGQASFHVTGPAVAVRLLVADLAKNESGWEQLPIKNGGTSVAAGGSALPPLGSDAGQTPPPLSGQVADRAWSPTGGGTAPGGLTKAVARTGADAAETGSGGGSGRPMVVAAGGSDAASPAPSPARTPRGTLPPVKMMRKRQVTIDYEVTKYGPSGIKSVELYVTRDDGRTWLRCDGEDNISVPLPTETRGVAAAFKRSLTVELQADGLYGFYLVVKSGAGLGKPPPQNGIDVPQMRIEVDTTAPKADLFEPKPHPTRRDCLILMWKATDNKLGATPITWQWAERPDGDWQTIGGEMPNSGEMVGQVPDITGSYVWQVPASVPPHVYLRLLVRDLAGNESVAQTAQPVLVDLNEPEVKPLDINVNSR